MESSSAASSKRKHRKHKKHKATERPEDTISRKLPESLIIKILSYLPTKEAVCTSVLSKRWVHRWTSMTRFDLHDNLFYSSKYWKSSGKKKSGGKLHFINFVNRLLALNDSSIESFSLRIGDKYDVSLLNTWISSILIRRVKNLRICTNSELSFSPLTYYLLFNFPYFLEELELELCCSAIKIPGCSAIKIPGCFYFSNLKLLKLCGVICTFDSSLELSVPNLKKFETKNCSWLSGNKSNNVTVKAPLLESILIEHDFESVSREPRSCKISFSGSQLKEFTYNGDGGISQPIIVSPPSAAHNASVNIVLKNCDNSVPETGSCAFLLLKQFIRVKSIKFDGSKVLMQPNVAVLPEFAILSHLELNLVTNEVLLALLQKSPILKTLVLKGISKFEQELLNSCVVPECLTSTLQIVKFEDVNANEHELYLAKLFLENGVVLERMSFYHCWKWASPKKSKVMEEFKEKLFSFKKGFSSFAIVEFI